jgi:hypothetical protein
MPSNRSQNLRDRAGNDQIPRDDTDFDRLFWRGRAIHDLQEAFTALQKSPSPFGGWERVFLSAAIEHFRAQHFERSARAARRILSTMPKDGFFNGRFSQEKSLAEHYKEFEAMTRERS